MSKSTATKAGSEGVSKSALATQDSQSQTGQSDSTAVALSTLAAQGLSQETVEKLALELKEKLYQISIGLDDRIKASKIMQRGSEFTLIDAFIVKDFVDKRNGDISDKMVFALEFPQGDVQVIMQSDTRFRRELAETFQLARALGGKARFGPYLMIEKDTGQPQPALIFEKQPGFKAEVV